MKKTLLVMAVSSLLVACGSGSSGKPNSAPTSSKSNSVPYTTVGGMTMQQYTSKSGKVKGNLAYDKELSKVAKTFTIADDATSIMLNGKKIDLIKGENLFGSENVFFIDTGYRNLEDEYVGVKFVGGEPTQKMPDTGVAKYILDDRGGYLDVTFAGKDKGVTGKIETFEVAAKLSGNTFEGTHKFNYNGNKKLEFETHLRGGFYGKNAMETAGFWSIKSTVEGKDASGWEDEVHTFYGVKKK
ncbi:MAG: transferrin-binding protein-like solute binding protein [Gammaproteobacteria bacterium]|nr:transferrin-binding protein-like solute binding protein [Gammaproteobacteria bacterium]